MPNPLPVCLSVCQMYASADVCVIMSACRLYCFHRLGGPIKADTTKAGVTETRPSSTKHTHTQAHQPVREHAVTLQTALGRLTLTSRTSIINVSHTPDTLAVQLVCLDSSARTLRHANRAFHFLSAVSSVSRLVARLLTPASCYRQSGCRALHSPTH